MIIEITNNSSVKAVIKLGKKLIKLPKHKTVTLRKNGTNAVIGIYPKMDTSYDRSFSQFVVLSEYKVDGEKISMIVDYQHVKVKVDAYHIYYRFAEVSGQFKGHYSILPPEKKLHRLGTGFLINLPITLFFEGTGILTFSAIVGFVTESLKKGIIAFLIFLFIISLYWVVNDVIFDKLYDMIFNNSKKKSKPSKNANEPLFFEICSNSDYIEYCFFDGTR